ncbi:MAG: di-heme enzyme [Acidobacteria bacterium]|nr:MAG: di-heme enzyme [Acidobacteriota bacterium]
MRVTVLVVALVFVFSIRHSAFGIDSFHWSLPRGLPVPRVPADNSISQPKIELGRRLFYDKRLSGNGSYSCASCHQQAFAFTDGLARAVGSTGAEHARSTMTLTNVAYNVTYGWADSGLRTLEAQMLVPMLNEHPIEMGLKGHEARIVARFSSDRASVAAFGAAFPREPAPVSLQNIVKSIASFERTLVSADSPFDRYLYRDDKNAMSAAALRGKDLFFSETLGCSECHASFNLSGPVTFERATRVEPLFHNTGLYNVNGRGAYPRTDRGLMDRTHNAADMGRFRAPTLRNVAVTAPYMHDGSIETLQAAIDHYARGGVTSPLKSKRIKGFPITPEQRRDLVAFLESLTDKSFLTNPAFGPVR